MKKKRKVRVRKQKLKQRKALIKTAKEQKRMDRMEYLNRVRQTPVLNDSDSPLVRNNKVLDRMLAEHEALVQFREDNKIKEPAQERIKTNKQRKALEEAGWKFGDAEDFLKETM